MARSLLQHLRHPLCALERLRSRYRPPTAPTPEALARHAAAQEAGAESYTDPVSGRPVFTARYLASLGACCGLRCRHCPYPQ